MPFSELLWPLQKLFFFFLAIWYRIHGAPSWATKVLGLQTQCDGCIQIVFDMNSGLFGFVLCVGGIYFSLLSIAVIKWHDWESLGKERTCLSYLFQSQSNMKRTQRRNSGETWRQRSRKNAASCLLLVICSALLPMVCTIDNGLVPHSPIINQETLYTDSWGLHRSKPHWFLALRGWMTWDSKLNLESVSNWQLLTMETVCSSFLLKSV